jgi:cytochrome c oxidase cbb3-type subunit III
MNDGDWLYGGDDASLFTSIKEGRPRGMPPFGGVMSDAEIRRVVAFIRSLSQGGE